MGTDEMNGVDPMMYWFQKEKRCSSRNKEKNSIPRHDNTNSTPNIPADLKSPRSRKVRSKKSLLRGMGRSLSGNRSLAGDLRHTHQKKSAAQGEKVPRTGVTLATASEKSLGIKANAIISTSAIFACSFTSPERAGFAPISRN